MTGEDVYQKKVCLKKLVQSKGLNVHHYLVILKDIAKDQCKILTKNNFIDDNRAEDKSNESDNTRKFVTKLRDKKINGKTTKSISVKTCINNFNLHSLIIKLVNVEKTLLKKI